ncbi:MAG TPA: hypothetical protein VD994_06905 [Prosthecobacter sp.]|nr:hypothetical protein [Prosthecobacter sp.]
MGTAKRALEVMQLGESCVLKSHSIINIDLPALRDFFHSIRILRNYKDSLISRALYCRNVRSAEGAANELAEQKLIDECEGAHDVEFLNIFLSEFENLDRWLEDIVIFERGDFDQTFYYEMLLHNPHDQFAAWLEKTGLSSKITLSQLSEALEQCAFQKMRQKKTPGFVGSTGVGQWMHWLEPEVSNDLDSRYFKLRELAARFPTVRRPLLHKVA